MATSGPAESDAFVAGQSKVPVSKWQGFLTFLYNSKEGTVLGRTGKSWLQITIFYIIFYGVLAAFFSVLLILFLQTLDPNEPKWQGDNGIIGNTPGMGFRPIPPDSGSTLVWVKHGNGTKSTTQDVYVTGLQKFLEPYQPGSQMGDSFVDCSDGYVATKGEKKTCRFDVQRLRDCAKSPYGYNQGQPCVLLKLNRIYNWMPDSYGPAELPSDLVDLYNKQKKGNNLVQSYKPNQVFITCNGEDLVDQEHIGPISIYPETMPNYYFPYVNQPGYLSPIVMVQFLNADPGVLINVECKAWAKNIKHNRNDRLGQVHFEILVDR